MGQDMKLFQHHHHVARLIAPGVITMSFFACHTKANEQISIHDMMTADELEATGIERLSESEIEALNVWFRKQTRYKYRSESSDRSVEVENINNSVKLSKQGSSRAADAETASTDNLSEFGLPEPSPKKKDQDKQLKANVLQPFRGWKGKTVFKLDNGQIWQQRASGRYTYTGDDTRVLFTVNGFGFYEMKLISANRSVGVKRIK